MKNILYTLTILLILVGCSAIDKPSRPTIGLQLLLEKQLPFPIEAIGITQDAKSLFVTDGTLLGESGIDFATISVGDLSVRRCFTITDEMSNNYPWSSSSLAYDNSRNCILVYNQYIDLSTNKTLKEMNLQSAIEKPNVCPEPLSISPNGKLALIIVGSYTSHDESALAVFDLLTGECVGILGWGKNVESGNSCFMTNRQVAIYGYDGSVSVLDLDTKATTMLPAKGPTPPILPFRGKNLCMRPLRNGKELLLSGGKEVAVFDVNRKKRLRRWPSLGGNAIPLDSGKLVLWQHYSSILTAPGCPAHDKKSRPAPVLAVADTQSGQVLAEVKLPHYSYDLLLLDQERTHLYAVKHDVIYKFRINLSKVYP